MEVQCLLRKLSAFASKNRVRPPLNLVALQCAASAAPRVKRVSPPALCQLHLPGRPRSPADFPVLVQVFPVELSLALTLH